MNYSKIALLILLIIVLCSNFKVQAKKAIGPPTGFRDLYWGAVLDNLPEKNNMKKIITVKNLDPEESKYSKINENPMIGGVGPFTIEYVFWRNRFAGIEAYSYGRENFNKLVTSATEAFGDKKRIEDISNFKRLVWQIGKTEISITIWGDEEYSQVHLSMKSLNIESRRSDLKKIQKQQKKSLSQLGW